MGWLTKKTEKMVTRKSELPNNVFRCRCNLIGDNFGVETLILPILNRKLPVLRSR